MNNFILNLSLCIVTSLMVISCTENTSNPISEISKSALLGKWVNVVDTVWSMSWSLNSETKQNDTTYCFHAPTSYWDTINFIDSLHCISGNLKDTMQYWFTDTLTMRYIHFKGYENHKWFGECAWPFEQIGSCIRMKPYIYSKLNAN